MNHKLQARELRHQFLARLLRGLRVVWPILAGLLMVMVALGSAVALLEHWSLFEGIYFAFVSGLTIGYGDFAPKGALGRVLAICIGVTGILFTALVAAVAVQALNATEAING